MKLTRVAMLLLVLTTGRAWAQQSLPESIKPTTPFGAAGSNSAAVPVVVKEPTLTQSEINLLKHLDSSGAQTQPSKTKYILGAPRRFLHSINPCAKSEHATEFENVRDLNPRAWTTIAGWHPGSSAFADAVTHESVIGLISSSRQ